MKKRAKRSSFGYNVSYDKRVIGIFPDEYSLPRLMGSVLIERHEAAQNGRAVFGQEHYEALLKSGIPPRLTEPTVERRRISAA